MDRGIVVIPFQSLTEAQFFEVGRDTIGDAERITPHRSRLERLWGHPGLRPIGARHVAPGSPLLSYKWEFTDKALNDQLAVESDGFSGTLEPGHAAVRYTNPVDGGDVLPTMRTEMHRIVRGAQTAPIRETGSSVYQVFDGSGVVTIGEQRLSVTRGDLFVVPSWYTFSASSEAASSDSDSGASTCFDSATRRCSRLSNSIARR